ncbi:hypothetical protein KBT16_21505 [Nostoc sp. CCCryo 231-06]|nr:hypothetical protein [Nostoc sp. CCCryo 231-06]
MGSFPSVAVLIRTYATGTVSLSGLIAEVMGYHGVFAISLAIAIISVLIIAIKKS